MISRRQTLTIITGVVGLTAISTVAVRLFAEEDDRTLEVLKERYRQFGSIAPAEPSWSGPGEARAYLLGRIVEAERRENGRDRLTHFYQIRAEDFAAGRVTGLDGWPFAEIELAVLRMLEA